MRKLVESTFVTPLLFSFDALRIDVHVYGLK